MNSQQIESCVMTTAGTLLAYTGLKMRSLLGLGLIVAGGTLAYWGMNGESLRGRLAGEAGRGRRGRSPRPMEWTRGGGQETPLGKQGQAGSGYPEPAAPREGVYGNARQRPREIPVTDLDEERRPISRQRDLGDLDIEQDTEAQRGDVVPDRVEEASDESFPASDAPGWRSTR